MLRLLIDGDSIVYRAACAVETRTYVKDEGLPTEQEFPGMKKRDILQQDPDAQLTLRYTAEPESHALHIAKKILMDIMDSCMEGMDEDEVNYDLYLTNDAPTCFRYAIAQTQAYKSTREKRRPIHFEAVRKYLRIIWGAEIVDPFFEADDILAMESHNLSFEPNTTTIIVGIDKDLDTIPGYHYNYVLRKKYQLNEIEAYKNYCMQILTGDSSDAVPGLPGIGPIKAERILDYDRWAEKHYPLGLHPLRPEGDEMRDWLYDRVLDAYMEHLTPEPDQGGSVLEPVFRCAEASFLLRLIREEQDLTDVLDYMADTEAFLLSDENKEED